MCPRWPHVGKRVDDTSGKETRSASHPLQWTGKASDRYGCGRPSNVRPTTGPEPGGTAMKRRLIAAVSLSLAMGLGGMHSAALAQQTQAPVITGNVNGSCVMAPPVGNPGANAGDWTISCGDLNPGAGMTVIGPPSVEKGPPPIDLAPVPAPASDSEPVSVDEPAPVEEPAAETTVDADETDTAVASETDLDADNYPDALELEVGLDPTNPDTDGDGVADGDEVNLYGTDPFTWDTDGDGLSDGEELFVAGTDPLVWDTNDDGISDGGVEAVADVDPLLAEDAAPVVADDAASSTTSTTSVDSDADRLADAEE